MQAVDPATTYLILDPFGQRSQYISIMLLLNVKLQLFWEGHKIFKIFLVVLTFTWRKITQIFVSFSKKLILLGYKFKCNFRIFCPTLCCVNFLCFRKSKVNLNWRLMNWNSEELLHTWQEESDWENNNFGHRVVEVGILTR